MSEYVPLRRDSDVEQIVSSVEAAGSTQPPHQPQRTWKIERASVQFDQNENPREVVDPLATSADRVLHGKFMRIVGNVELSKAFSSLETNEAREDRVALLLEMVRIMEQEWGLRLPPMMIGVTGTALPIKLRPQVTICTLTRIFGALAWLMAYSAMRCAPCAGSRFVRTEHGPGHASHRCVGDDGWLRFRGNEIYRRCDEDCDHACYRCRNVGCNQGARQTGAPCQGRQSKLAAADQSSHIMHV
eukprot:COSAG05_NODE_858_length_6935_cov_2.188414_2_plen_244_part_00